MEDRSKLVAIIMVALLAIVIAVMATGALITSWVENHYGPDAVLFAWGSIAVIGGIMVGWRMALSTQRSTMQALIDLKAAEDNRENVERYRTERQALRNQAQLDRPAIQAMRQYTNLPPSHSFPQLPPPELDWNEEEEPQFRIIG